MMYSAIKHDAYLKLLDEHAIISTTDASGTIIDCNEKFCQISGYRRNELIGHSHRILKSGMHPESFYRALWTTLLTGNTWHGEICNRRKDGSFYWVEASITPILDADGQPVQYISIRTDITLIKEIENSFNRELTNSLPGIFYMLDASGRFLSWNDQLAKVLHCSHDEIRHGRALDFFEEADHGMVERNIHQVFEHGETSMEAMLVSKNGARTPYHFTGKRVIRNDSPVLIGLGIDITERRQAEEESRKASEELAAIFDSSKVSIVYIKDRVIIKTNCKFDEIFGFQPNELIGQSTRILHIDEETYNSVVTGAAPIMARGESYHRVMEMRRKDGSHFWARLSGCALASDLSRGSVWTCEDVTVEHLARERIHNMAFYDALTQLPNRRMLDDRLSQALTLSKRSNRFGALMFLDLDNFKPLNDKYGHAVGDLLLIEVARRITGCLREVDTVARFGGDEFVAILNELDTGQSIAESQAERVAEKIRICLSEPYSLTFHRNDGNKTTVNHHCSSSIGIVMFAKQDSDQSDILKWADMAMYKAKEAGRNQIYFLDRQILLNT